MEEIKIKPRRIAVFLFLLSVPCMGMHGQDQYLAENQSGKSRVSGGAIAENNDVLHSPTLQN